MKINFLRKCKFKFNMKIPIATPCLFKFGLLKTNFSKSFLKIADGPKSPKFFFCFRKWRNDNLRNYKFDFFHQGLNITLLTLSNPGDWKFVDFFVHSMVFIIVRLTQIIAFRIECYWYSVSAVFARTFFVFPTKPQTELYRLCKSIQREKFSVKVLPSKNW